MTSARRAWIITIVSDGQSPLRILTWAASAAQAIVRAQLRYWFETDVLEDQQHVISVERATR
jgi:hypothetical protein